jgi:hypothetical protein
LGHHAGAGSRHARGGARPPRNDALDLVAYDILTRWRRSSRSLPVPSAEPAARSECLSIRACFSTSARAAARFFGRSREIAASSAPTGRSSVRPAKVDPNRQRIAHAEECLCAPGAPAGRAQPGIERRLRNDEEKPRLRAKQHADPAEKAQIARALAQLTASIWEPESDVDRGFKRLVAHAASRAAGCQYCMAHTAGGALHFGIEDRHFLPRTDG